MLPNVLDLRSPLLAIGIKLIRQPLKILLVDGYDLEQRLCCCPQLSCRSSQLRIDCYLVVELLQGIFLALPQFI